MIPSTYTHASSQTVQALKRHIDTHAVTYLFVKLPTRDSQIPVIRHGDSGYRLPVVRQARLVYRRRKSQHALITRTRAHERNAAGAASATMRLWRRFGGPSSTSGGGWRASQTIIQTPHKPVDNLRRHVDTAARARDCHVAVGRAGSTHDRCIICMLVPVVRHRGARATMAVFKLLLRIGKRTTQHSMFLRRSLCVNRRTPFQICSIRQEHHSGDEGRAHPLELVDFFNRKRQKECQGVQGDVREPTRSYTTHNQLSKRTSTRTSTRSGYPSMRPLGASRQAGKHWQASRQAGKLTTTDHSQTSSRLACCSMYCVALQPCAERAPPAHSRALGAKSTSHPRRG